MNLSRYEQETIINFNEEESTASVYTHNRTLRRKLDKLAADRPNDCKLYRVSHDGQAAAEFYVPKWWIKVSPPRTVSDAQRAANRTALQKARSMAKTL